MRRLSHVLRAGALRKRLTIKAPSTARDTFGGSADIASNSLDGWTDVATVSGSVAPYEGREMESAGKPTGELTTIIEMRYLSGVTQAMRVLQVDTGQVYDIRAVLDVEGRRRKTMLFCRERN